MKKFESVIILKPNLMKDEIKEILEKVEETIQKVAKITNKQEIGIKKLAYEIKKNSEGIYVLINFEAAPTLIKELERVYRITDEVIKFIVVRKED